MYIENIHLTNMLNNFTSKYSNALVENNIVKKYTSVEEEYNALIYGSGIYINFDPVIINLEGNDVLSYLNRISTNTVKELQSGKIVNTLFLNEIGRIIDRTVLLHLENNFLLISLNSLHRLLNWVRKYIISEDIITSTVSNYALITLAGPQSDSFLTIILGDELKNITGENFIQTHIDGLSFTIFLQIEKENIRQFKILIEKEMLNSFVNYLISNKSVFDVLPVGEDAYNIYRIKKGIPAKNEISHFYNPNEAGLIREISFSKKHYIGQNAITRSGSSNNVQRKMYIFSCAEKIITDDNLKLFNQDNDEIGIITSSVYLEKNYKTIGLALIEIKFVTEDTEYYFLFENKKNFIEELDII